MKEDMTEEELLKFIVDIEENNLVKAPPQIAEGVFDKIDKTTKIIEYKRFRNRVIAAAAILILVTVAPVWEVFLPEDRRQATYEEEKPMDDKLKEDKQYEIAGMDLLRDFFNNHYVSGLFNEREE